MDMLQLVFAFVNAPVFATFLLGMFWKRATGHGAFVGLVAGTMAAMIHHGIALPAGAVAGIKGGWITVLHPYSTEMAQNFWTAIWSFSVCLLTTITVSLVTKPPTQEKLVGLVHSLTPKVSEPNAQWWQRPAILGVLVVAATAVLNIIFF
jgi:SSS family solute:Na+ symporter